MCMQALHFSECNNLLVSGLTHINSPKNHISLNRCNGSLISKLHFIAPDESPNTDGIDISYSSNILIKNSKMETGKSHISVIPCLFFLRNLYKEKVCPTIIIVLLSFELKKKKKKNVNYLFS